MKQYHDILKHILISGTQKGDRTGTGTLSVFGYQARFDLGGGFPLLTTKRVHWKSVVHELLWFISGSTNIKYLQDNGVTIWNEWADANGDLGPVYGKQWRDFNGIDQLKEVVQRIKDKPNDRRLIVSAWNPVDVPRMKLPPCHCFYQFYVADGRLSLQMYQRSADTFLGVPFNIASYALLLAMVAYVTDLKPGELIMTFGDLHIYNNHFDQVYEQLDREYKNLPAVRIREGAPKDLFALKFEDIILEGYDPHPAIKAPVAV